jgi:hypothetical protein
MKCPSINRVEQNRVSSGQHTPHNARINVAFLNNHFGDRWMGRYLRTYSMAPEIPRFESIGFLSMGLHSKQCLFGPTSVRKYLQFFY